MAVEIMMHPVAPPPPPPPSPLSIQSDVLVGQWMNNNEQASKQTATHFTIYAIIHPFKWQIYIHVYVLGLCVCATRNTHRNESFHVLIWSIVHVLPQIELAHKRTPNLCTNANCEMKSSTSISSFQFVSYWIQFNGNKSK